MSANNQWLREQRVAGGTSFASSILRTQIDTGKYVEHIVNVVAKNKNLLLQVTETLHGYEVTLGENIVWFGREIDVELLRATSSTAFEKYLYARIERLEQKGLVEVVEEEIKS